MISLHAVVVLLKKTYKILRFWHLYLFVLVLQLLCYDNALNVKDSIILVKQALLIFC